MNVLLAVTVIPLDKHDLFGDGAALVRCKEADDCASARIRLLVTVCDAHTTADRDIEAGQLSVLVHDRDESDIVREDVDVVHWRNSDGDFELKQES